MTLVVAGDGDRCASVWATAVAAAVVASAMLLALMTSSAGGWMALVLTVWSVPVTIAAIEDAFTARLRDAVVLRGCAGTLLVSVLAGLLTGDSGALAGAAAGAAALGGWLLVFHLISPAGMGFGDVKFGVLLGSGVGAIAPVGVVLVVVAAVVLQIVVVATRLLPAQRRGVVGRHEAPFGPSLAASALLIVIALARGGAS